MNDARNRCMDLVNGKGTGYAKCELATFSLVMNCKRDKAIGNGTKSRVERAYKKCITNAGSKTFKCMALA
jgi:hypothetical protein